MALVGSLVVGMSARTEDFERGMRRARQELTQTQTAIGQIGTHFTNLGRTLGATAVAALSLNAIKNGVEDVVRSGLQLERLRASFTALTGSTQRGAQEFTFVRDTANRLGLDLTTLAESYRGLTAATRGTTLEGQATRDLFVALTQSARTFGLSTEATGRALTALQQIISKGKVSQEELRQQLGEAIPGASQIAARAFGVTTAEFDKMVEKGIEATEFIRRFTTQLSKETPAAVANVRTGFAELGNELLELKARIAQSGLLDLADRLAAAAAKILAAERVRAEQAAAVIQRSAIQATRGATDPTKDFSENAKQLLAIVEQLTTAEAELTQAQQRLNAARSAAESRGVPFSLFTAEAQRVPQLQREVDLLRQQRDALGEIQKSRQEEAKQTSELSKMLTEVEIGPQFDAQQVKAQQDAILEKARELQRIEGEVNAIRNRNKLPRSKLRSFQEPSKLPMLRMDNPGTTRPVYRWPHSLIGWLSTKRILYANGLLGTTSYTLSKNHSRCSQGECLGSARV